MFASNTVELSGRRVLIVEDEYHAAEELSATIRASNGIVVGPVPTVDAALALVERGEMVDAAILDINLGGEKVFPVAEALKAIGIPIIFVTGYDDWMIPQEYEDTPVLRKPAEADNVVQLLFSRI
ncbi:MULTISPECIES: response regulator [Aureimonas]|uniref:Response regulatory domain-containing protein n=1 Tax=Aureimonas ureilytica TaxID=401562 RepID=A0A175R5K1_9HYPH|nr:MULTISPECIES: response regulator [Aureimonas]KTQ90491.1 hypothetical protein NS226_16130 [Aureimonas ureilytica]